MKQTIAMFLVALVLILGGRESRARDLRDIIPGLYGGDGITLAPASGHSPHFTVASAASIIVPDSKEWNEVDRSKKPFLF